MGRAGSGGRSSGGGSSRSRSSSGGSRSRSSSSSRAGSSRSSGYGSSRSYGGSSYNYSRNSYNIGNSYSYGSGYGGSSYRGVAEPSYGVPAGSGGLNPIFAIIVTFIIAVVLCLIIYEGDGGPKSTIVREKIDSGQSFNANCIKDELGWFDSYTSAGRKLNYFHEQTGVQPYIYLKAYDSTLTNLDMKKEYAKKLYEELFDDRADVFLYIYFAEANQDEDIGDEAWWIGAQASSVMDNEAMDIFWHKLDSVWYTDMSTDDLFIQTFTHTADKIMKVDKGPWVAIAAIGIVAGTLCVIIYVLKIVKEKNRRAKEEAEETIKILSTDIDKLAKSSEEEDLVNKYT